MSAPDAYRVSPLPADPFPAFGYLDSLGFSAPDPGPDEHLTRALLDPARSRWAVPAGGAEPAAVVGVLHGGTLRLPGGTVPTGLISPAVTHPLHRRRGLLRRLMVEVLGALHDEGVPLAALYASEAAIYGRFGFGPAVTEMTCGVDRGTALRDVPGAADVQLDLCTLRPDEHDPLLVEAYHGATVDRPGAHAPLPPQLMRRRTVAWPPDETKEPLRLLTARHGDGTLRGAAVLRREVTWDGSGPGGVVQVRMLAAADAAAARALWGVLVDLDLTSTVVVENRPLDDPLLHLVPSARLVRAKLAESVWLRVLDVPTALAARTVHAPLDLVVGVVDPVLPWVDGAWRVRADADAHPEVERVPGAADAADVVLTAADLARVLPGGTTVRHLAAAGLVTGAPEAVARLSQALASPVAPWNGMLF